jgi:hypothetical protein
MDTTLTYIFANDLLQRPSKDAPWKYLDIFLDIPWFRIRESHDELEELFAIGLGLGHGGWSEAF